MTSEQRALLESAYNDLVEAEVDARRLVQRHHSAATKIKATLEIEDGHTRRGKQD